MSSKMILHENLTVLDIIKLIIAVLKRFHFPRNGSRLSGLFQVPLEQNSVRMMVFLFCIFRKLCYICFLLSDTAVCF